MGVSEGPYFRWKKKYAGLGISELRELRQVREENRNHTFDIGLEDRRPLLAASALSFEVTSDAELARDIEVAARAIDGVRPLKQKSRALFN